MQSKKTILKKDKKYYFYVLHGIDIGTLEKIRFDYLGIKAVRLFSKEYEQLTDQIHQFESSFPEEFENFKAINGEDISLLFYSENEKNLDEFFYFLIMLRPSKIQKWLEVDTYYPETDIREAFNNKHTTGNEAIWKTAIELHVETKAEDIFKLKDSDISFANKLLKKYLSLSRTPTYRHFLSLYYRAYTEETDYFKYLLLFIVIESFITGDDKMGVTYKIRRFCAVIAGDNLHDSQLIYDKTSEAYNVRSSLVHNAKNKLPEARYLPYLHSLVCELGILILIGNLNKETLFNLTTTLGFGQRNQLIKDRVFKVYSSILINSVNFYLLEIPKKRKKK